MPSLRDCRWKTRGGATKAEEQEKQQSRRKGGVVLYKNDRVKSNRPG